jgi:hypothetical protein
MEQPARSDDLCSQGFGPSPELAIGGHERDRLVGRSPSHHIDKGVIATAISMDHGDAIGRAGGRARARLTFEDHDHGLVDPTRSDGSP